MVTTRKETTIYLDRDLLRAVEELAASTGRHDYEIIEDALRQYLGTSQSVSREALRDLLDEVAERADLTDEDALGLAYAELHVARMRVTGDSDGEKIAVPRPSHGDLSVEARRMRRE